MSLVQDKLVPVFKRSSFERWNLAEPNRVRPSLLYTLTPCGLGTPYVESLSSYVTRLANAHVVSVWRLILHVLSPMNPGRVPRSSTRYAYPANGLGKGSEILLRSFEAATCRSDLRLLTLTALQGTISQLSIFRTTEAWCPVCLEQWRTTGMPVHSPLLWAIRVVGICPVHLSPLVDRCPHCHRQFSTLRANAQPGYCSACSHWLGTFDLRPTKESLDDQRRALWTSTSVGQLLAAMPDLQLIEPHVKLIANLQRCLSQSEGLTRQSLATIAGAKPCAFLGWVSGRVRPSLGHLSGLSYQIKLPLIMLFKGVPPEWRGPEHLRQQSDSWKTNSWIRPAIASNELRSILTSSLSEDTPPSVAEVARRLKFRRTQTLWAREPELCRQIAARRRDSGRTVSAGAQLYARSEGQRLESILGRHVALENPLSLNEIASRLGYRGSGGIRERFPELCRAITAKRKQQFLQKRENMRHAIEDARAESPPPSLKEIARRLGFTSEGVLSTACPETCAVHMQWRRTWLQDQRNKLQLSIREWVAVEPAPTVASVCHHFGISHAYFQMYFPEENAEVVRRSAARLRMARDNHALIMRVQVLEIVRELREQNIYPSLSRVRSILSQRRAGHWPLLRPAIDEAISRFGATIRQRNEFGQFV